MADPTAVPAPERVACIGPQHLVDGLLNVVVYGPGKGEAIVVVLPDGRPAVIDGCREPQSGDPMGVGDPVRELLAALEQDRGAALELAFICLTHPHDDHYAGLGRLMEAYHGRVGQLIVPPIGAQRLRPALMRWIRTKASEDDPSGEQIRGLDRFLTQYQRSVEAEVPISALRAGVSLRPAGDVRLEVCGPSEADVLLARNKLAMYEAGQLKSDHFDPNRMSGALVVRWGDAGVLLAGDLVSSSKKKNRGWREAARHIHGPVQVVNVAHHASEEAHHTPLWARMAPKLAIVTPFKEAKGEQPPRPEMIATLAASSTVVVTSPPEWHGPAPSPVARNRAIPVTPPPQHDDRFNAAAVALDATGAIRRLVLAGKAEIHPPRPARIGP